MTRGRGIRLRGCAHLVLVGVLRPSSCDGRLFAGVARQSGRRRSKPVGSPPATFELAGQLSNRDPDSASGDTDARSATAADDDGVDSSLHGHCRAREDRRPRRSDRSAAAARSGAARLACRRSSTAIAARASG